MLGFKENVLLAPFTTLRVGGPARFFCEVRTLDELTSALRLAEARDLPVRIFGGGSNVLVGDDGFSGLVIRMCMKSITYAENGDTVFVTGAAGEDWDAFVENTTKNNLWGLENLSLIPGTVGASPVQNVGAYGVEIKDVVYAVEAYDTHAHVVRVLAPSECAFGYRDSIFKHKDGTHLIITNVVFRLSKIPNPHIKYPDVTKELGEADILMPQKIREAIIAIRTRKLPSPEEVGTAGSFFKNPIISKADFEQLAQRFPGVPSFSVSEDRVKVPLAWILDHVLHLNGYREGDIGLWPTQPLVVVNYDNASARDIASFAQTITEKVFTETKIKIEREVVAI